MRLKEAIGGLPRSEELRAVELVEASGAAPPITQRRILLFWLPLAASWLLMSAEIPAVSAAIARLGEAERMLAAFGIVASLSITIESPVIMLLATSTALARTSQNYQMLRRFTGHLILGTTVLHALLGWTPLFDVVVRSWMGVPENIVEPVRLGMRLMLFWSGAIAWRRFKQGVLIRLGLTRFVAQGTAVRLVASAGTALALALSGRTPGVAVGALALSAGVLSEAVYAHLAARRPVREHFGVNGPATRANLSYWELVRFHTPLALTSLLFLLAQPMISAALSRLPDPEIVLAAWPVTASVLFLTRAPALALPEAIIALLEEKGSFLSLRQFSLRIGLACMAALALLSFTPLGRFYYQTVIGVREELAARAILGGQIGLLVPFIMASQSWFRGLLTARRDTLPVTLAMGLHLLVMAGTLSLGVAVKTPGVALAALALTLAMGAETAVLWRAARPSRVL